MQEAGEDTRRFVVGLGNPGRQYARTRHNVGFRVVEALADRWGADAGRTAFGGRLREARPARPGGPVRRVVLFEPHTYMNRSGSAVREMVLFYKADPRDLLVVMDDLALPPGRLRARQDGSAGGHRGLADILQALGSQDIARLRVGIGAPPPRMEATDYVLGTFAEDEAETMEAAIAAAADAVEDWVFRDLAFVMEKHNRKPQD